MLFQAIKRTFNCFFPMRKIPISLFLSFALNLYSQTPVGSWSDHLSYNTARSLAVSTKDVFVSTGSSIVVYNKEFAELKKMSKINGLTETGISAIGWSEETDALVIGYSSTNVDLFINNTIFNIPDIYNKYIPGNKEINRIRTNGKYAYLACSFGIVVIDIIKKEIYDTWKPGRHPVIMPYWISVLELIISMRQQKPDFFLPAGQRRVSPTSETGDVSIPFPMPVANIQQ